jgi:hypothetical protein
MWWAVRSFHWLTAVALIASLYAHTVVGLDANDVTPIVALVVLSTLTVSAVLSAPLPNRFVPRSAMRQLAAVLGLYAILCFSALNAIHSIDENPDVHDLGKICLQCGLPILLILQSDRKGLFNAISLLCVFAALADAAWNFATLVDLVSPVARAQRITDYGSLVRYPGLTGNTLSTGEVALIAICFVAYRLSTAKSILAFWLLTFVLLFIMFDMALADARRFTGKAIVALIIFLTPWLRRRAPLHIICVAVALIYLYLTFASLDPENIQRSNLIVHGWWDVQDHAILGAGLHYVQAHGVTFQSLWSAGITESGVVDLMKAYGIPATLIFLGAGLCALSARRIRPTDVSVLFCLFLADLECGSPIDGFLGAVLFFLGFILIVYEEAPYGARRQVAAAQRASHPADKSSSGPVAAQVRAS